MTGSHERSAHFGLLNNLELLSFTMKGKPNFIYFLKIDVLHKMFEEPRVITVLQQRVKTL
jgi:hypothetical protein